MFYFMKRWNFEILLLNFFVYFAFVKKKNCFFFFITSKKLIIISILFNNFKNCRVKCCPLSYKENCVWMISDKVNSMKALQNYVICWSYKNVVQDCSSVRLQFYTSIAPFVISKFQIRMYYEIVSSYNRVQLPCV